MRDYQALRKSRDKKFEALRTSRHFKSPAPDGGSGKRPTTATSHTSGERKIRNSGYSQTSALNNPSKYFSKDPG